MSKGFECLKDFEVQLGDRIISGYPWWEDFIGGPKDDRDSDVAAMFKDIIVDIDVDKDRRGEVFGVDYHFLVKDRDMVVQILLMAIRHGIQDVTINWWKPGKGIVQETTMSAEYVPDKEKTRIQEAAKSHFGQNIDEGEAWVGLHYLDW